MQILVTGANGQLGSEIKELQHKYSDFTFEFTDIDTLDITNEEAVREFFNEKTFDVVINCAAYTAVDKAESDIKTASDVNSVAPALLARYSKKIGAKLIQVSTDYVFDGESNIPYSEEDEVHPQGVYGETKLMGEKYCLRENPETAIVRTAWLYSSFGNNFVKTMLRLASERDELGVVFDQVGTPTYAADLADALLQIAGSTKFVPGIYHYSNEGVASWFDFANSIFEIAKVECKVKPVRSDQFPTPAKRPNYSVLDKAKIKSTYDLFVPYWKESLTNCIEKLTTK